MSNDKVSLEKDNSMTEPRKSRIVKGLQRTLSTAKYESIVIYDQIEEEIEWRSLDEHEEKRRNWETVLLKSFKTSLNRILDELDLGHKKAYFKDNLQERDLRPEPGDQGDFADLNLDELDTLR